MNIIFVLVIIGIAIGDTSYVSNDTEATTKGDDHDVAQTSSSEESRRIRPVFPASAKKFVLTTKSTRIRNITTRVNRRSKRPVFKIISKPTKMRHKNYWKTTTTRPSLMKYTKFTVNPLNINNIYKNSENLNHKTNKDKEIRRRYDSNQFRKIMNDSSKYESSEEILERSTTNRERNDKMRHVKTLVQRFYKLGSKIKKDELVENISKLKEKVEKLVTRSTTTTTDKMKSREAEFSSEENEDRKEFIFVTPKKTKEHTSTVTNDSDESGETTTITELKLRRKRSINVIEEENLGTTVSGFKFTGKVASLTNNLAFRNINT